MFEFEASRNRPTDELDASDKSLFADSEAEIVALSMISWEEHCTECSMPACFSTCDLYSPRADGKCRRFVRDMALVDNVPTPQGYAVRVEFKRWAQLMAYANVHMVPLERARRLERITLQTDRVAAKIPGRSIRIAGIDQIPQKAERKFKRWMNSGGVFGDKTRKPDYFVVEAHNPGDSAVPMSLTMRNPEGPRAAFAFQQLLTIEPGFNRIKIEYSEITNIIDASGEIQIMLSPNILREEDEGLTLYFGTIGFVQDRAYNGAGAVTSTAASARGIGSAKAKGVKIVIWDLDNTVWDGVLVEDGPEGLKLNPEIRSIMQELDRRGIVNSVVSKNDHDRAMEQLERFELAEYIVFPRISWDPKGSAVAAVIEDFNVGADTIVFVDDQPFEREQVQAVVPQVRVIDGRDYGEILSLDEMNPELSSESGRRREFYQNQKIRRTAESGHAGDYEVFLKNCGIRLLVDTDGQSKVDRVHELVQRTNQMNFSGTRYDRSQIGEILTDVRYDSYVLTCSDKFGDYGIIGFGLVEKEGPEKEGPRLIDLMFSCRIQSKRVEHSFLIHLFEHYKAAGAKNFSALYRRTDRNAPSGRVFDDLGFTVDSEVDGITAYSFDLEGDLPRNEIIEIAFENSEATPE